MKTKTAKDKNYNKIYGVTLLECELIAIPVYIFGVISDLHLKLSLHIIQL